MFAEMLKLSITYANGKNELLEVLNEILSWRDVIRPDLTALAGPG